MEEIIRQLEHTIEYFKDAQTDFQKGRVFEAETTLQALRIHDVSNSVKIALLKQLEELSDYVPAEIYTKKVIEIKSNFNVC
jgi:hypothetical protein